MQAIARLPIWADIVVAGEQYSPSDIIAAHVLEALRQTARADPGLEDAPAARPTRHRKPCQRYQASQFQLSTATTSHQDLANNHNTSVKHQQAAQQSAASSTSNSSSSSRTSSADEEVPLRRAPAVRTRRAATATATANNAWEPGMHPAPKKLRSNSGAGAARSLPKRPASAAASH